jgi:hypothetical protein
MRLELRGVRWMRNGRSTEFSTVGLELFNCATAVAQLGQNRCLMVVNIKHID